MPRKKGLFFLCLCILLLVTSCSNAADIDEGASTILGTWILTSISVNGKNYDPAEYGLSPVIIEFNSDGTVSEPVLYNDGSNGTLHGFWSRNGKSVIISDDANAAVFTIHDSCCEEKGAIYGTTCTYVFTRSE